MNWKWPANRANNLAPWYVVMRRMVFVIPMYVGLAVCVVCYAGAYGIGEARRFWNMNK